MPELAQILGSGISAIGGIAQISSGASLSIVGGDIAASSFRQAGVASLAAANYNNAISRLNFNRQMDVLSREIRTFTSQQKVAAATTGFTGASKSFLEIENDTYSIFERMILDSRNSQAQSEQARLFEGRAAQVEFENRARAAEYQGQVAAAQSRSSAFSQIAKIFSGF